MMNNQWHFYAGKEKEEFSCVCVHHYYPSFKKKEKKKRRAGEKESQEAEQKDEKAQWSKHTIVLN